MNIFIIITKLKVLVTQSSFCESNTVVVEYLYPFISFDCAPAPKSIGIE